MRLGEGRRGAGDDRGSCVLAFHNMGELAASNIVLPEERKRNITRAHTSHEKAIFLTHTPAATKRRI